MGLDLELHSLFSPFLPRPYFVCELPPSLWTRLTLPAGGQTLPGGFAGPVPCTQSHWSVPGGQQPLGIQGRCLKTCLGAGFTAAFQCPPVLGGGCLCHQEKPSGDQGNKSRQQRAPVASQVIKQIKLFRRRRPRCLGVKAPRGLGNCYVEAALVGEETKSFGGIFPLHPVPLVQPEQPQPCLAP